MLRPFFHEAQAFLSASWSPPLAISMPSPNLSESYPIPQHRARFSAPESHPLTASPQLEGTSSPDLPVHLPLRNQPEVFKDNKVPHPASRYWRSQRPSRISGQIELPPRALRMAPRCSTAFRKEHSMPLKFNAAFDACARRLCSTLVRDAYRTMGSAWTNSLAAVIKDPSPAREVASHRRRCCCRWHTSRRLCGLRAQLRDVHCQC